MTSEERLKYFEKKKNKTGSLKTTPKRNHSVQRSLKLRFWISVILMVSFLSLDYTGEVVFGYGSKEIVSVISKDTDLKHINFFNMLKKEAENLQMLSLK